METHVPTIYETIAFSEMVTAEKQREWELEAVGEVHQPQAHRGIFFVLGCDTVLVWHSHSHIHPHNPITLRSYYCGCSSASMTDTGDNRCACGDDSGDDGSKGCDGAVSSVVGGGVRSSHMFITFDFKNCASSGVDNADIIRACSSIGCNDEPQRPCTATLIGDNPDDVNGKKSDHERFTAKETTTEE